MFSFRNNKPVVFSWAAVALWMAVIFYLSHQPRVLSNQLSIGITERIVEVVEVVAPSVAIDVEGLNHIVRKKAHFCAYLVLGISVITALRASGIVGARGIVFAISICLLYAISDEIHQLFVPGRGGQLRDVIIDTLGAVTGIGLFVLVNRLVDRSRGAG